MQGGEAGAVQVRPWCRGRAVGACGWRGASSARGAASRARCGALGGAGHLGHGGGGVRTAGLPRLRGSVAGGEARGGEGERGGHGAGLLRRCHGDATAIHLPTRARKFRGSVASNASPQSRPIRRRRGAQCGQGRSGDRQDSIPRWFTHNFFEFGSDSVDLRMNSVHACQVFGTMPEPISISFF